MSPSYPQIVVTGDSISQQAFKIGGYGAALVDAVSTNWYVELTLTVLIVVLATSIKAKRMLSTAGWEDSM